MLESRPAIGSHAGWEYEIFVPEEINEQVGVSKSNQAQSKASENLHLHSEQDLLTLTPSKFVENKELTEKLNTSLKTNIKNDDEPFGTMIDILSQTGKGKREDWGELGQLLKMEFDIAASRTKGVTNAPKFLVEHLRRRLMPIKGETQKNKPTKSTQIGLQQPLRPIEEYRAEPLTKEGRESTLKTFAGYIKKGQKDFLISLEDTYTKEDWEWLMKELKID